MVKILSLIFIPSFAFGATPPPTAFPVFLRPGFSSILEFEASPVRVVLGDSQSFQVERLEKSIVIRTHANSASTNMFVYFKELNPRLFVLTASDEAEPTYFKRFESNPPKVPSPPVAVSSMRVASLVKSGARLVRTQFDEKKDYLIVSVEISADSTGPIRPEWNRAKLMSKGKEITPNQLWAERKEVQSDSRVKARFIFAKPDVTRDLKGVSLSLPTLDGASPYSLSIAEGGRR